MNVLGHSTGASLAVQHVSGQNGRLAATPADVAVFYLFIPWDGDEGEYRTFWASAPYIIVFYKCAYHNGSTWVLPSITQVIRDGGSGDDVPSSGRPYWTHVWPPVGQSGSDYSGFKMAGTDIATALGGGSVATAMAGYFAGANVYAAASQLYADGGLPACGLEFGIPPNAHHDLAIELLHSTYSSIDGALGTLFVCWASACRVDAQEGR